MRRQSGVWIASRVAVVAAAAAALYGWQVQRALGASWEPDVWGRHGADVKAAQALRITAVDRGIATLVDLLSYVEARYGSGHAFAYDADLVREQLALQRAKREPLIALIEARRRRLAVLTGQAAATLPAPTPLYGARLQSAKTDLLPHFGMQFLGGDAELHFAGLPSFGATGGLVGLSVCCPV